MNYLTKTIRTWLNGTQALQRIQFDAPWNRGSRAR
jgi:hypothetical protein